MAYSVTVMVTDLKKVLSLYRLLEYLQILNVHIAMCSLVMSLYTCDFLMRIYVAPNFLTSTFLLCCASKAKQG